MSRAISLVQRVHIASPCPVSWDSMTGDEQVRFCSHCKLNVYNLSAMTEAEGERLIIEKEGKLCAAIYRREDGTILTRDCPFGLRGIRRRTLIFGLKAAAALVCIAASTIYALEPGTSSEQRQPGVKWLRKRVVVVDGPTPLYQRTMTQLKAWMALIAPPPPPGPPAPGGIAILQPGCQYTHTGDKREEASQ